MVGSISPISGIDLWTSVLEFIVVSTLTYMERSGIQSTNMLIQ